jgi:hypothetical protein
VQRHVEAALDVAQQGVIRDVDADGARRGHQAAPRLTW